MRVPLVEQLFNGITPFPPGPTRPTSGDAPGWGRWRPGQLVLLMKFVVFQG